MTANFGSAWKSRFRDHDDFADQMKVWTKAVAGFGPEIVDLALQRVSGLDSQFPPTLAEFVGLCKNETLRRGAHCFKSLTKPEPNKAMGEAAIAKARERLAGALSAQAAPRPVGSPIHCDQCGGLSDTEAVTPRIVNGHVIAICPDCLSKS